MLHQEANSHMKYTARYSLVYEQGLQLHSSANLIKCWLYGYNGNSATNIWDFREIKYPLKQIAEDHKFIEDSWNKKKHDNDNARDKT